MTIAFAKGEPSGSPFFVIAVAFCKRQTQETLVTVWAGMQIELNVS